MDEPSVLISEQDLQKRVGEIAEQISQDYANVDELCLVGVLKGAFIFLADLSRRLTIPRRVDFIALSSYEDDVTVSTGAVRLIMDVRTPLAGKHVLVVEDIVDTGYTLEYLLRNLEVREPASLKTCSLLQKPDRLEVPLEIDYLGFKIPDIWVVGYGLDYADTYRTLPYIGSTVPPDEPAKDPKD
jgi:hypoxanthine phosphoribosyltransferase